MFKLKALILVITMSLATVVIASITSAGIGVAPVYASTGTHSHFRYGHITWVPVSGNTIAFTVQDAFRRDGYSGSGADGFAAPGDTISEGIGVTALCFGDAACTGQLNYLVTSIDPANNWLFALGLDPTSPVSAQDTLIDHSYSGTGTFTAFIDSCCRIFPIDGTNAHINNPSGGYRVETIVNVSTGNSSPVSTLPPIVNCPINAICTFTVPGSDPNGDPLNFRLSTSTEASNPIFSGFTQPGPPYAPNAASTSSSGIYTWDTTGATLGPSGTNTLYSTQVTIEDLASTGAVKGKVAVDFFIQLVTLAGVPPVFDTPPTPVCGSSIVATAGVSVSFSLQAHDGDSGDTVTLNVAGLPPGATMTPSLPTSGNPVSTMFSWIPATAQVGLTFPVVFTATDSTSQQVQCTITIQVSTIGLDLTPKTAINPPSTSHTVTATVTDTTGAPISGVTVSFTVTGANSASGSCVTSTSGQCTFTYTGNNLGADTITGTVTVGNIVLQATASKTWHAVGVPEFSTSMIAIISTLTLLALVARRMATRRVEVM